MPLHPNSLYYGDNLEVLRNLLAFQRSSRNSWIFQYESRVAVFAKSIALSLWSSF